MVGVHVLSDDHVEKTAKVETKEVQRPCHFTVFQPNERSMCMLHALGPFSSSSTPGYRQEYRGRRL